MPAVPGCPAHVLLPLLVLFYNMFERINNQSINQSIKFMPGPHIFIEEGLIGNCVEWENFVWSDCLLMWLKWLPSANSQTS